MMEPLTDPPSVTFFDRDGQRAGRLIIETTGLRFEGNADQAAEAFFGFLKRYIDNYMRQIAKDEEK